MGSDVPIPSLPELNQRLLFPVIVDPPLHSATWLVLPAPVTAPPPSLEAHPHTWEVLFHDSTSSFAQPVKRERPDEVSSSPEKDDVDDGFVPDVESCKAIASLNTDIPFPAPIFKVTSPVIPPPERPDPAVTDVISPVYMSVIRYVELS